MINDEFKLYSESRICCFLKDIQYLDFSSVSRSIFLFLFFSSLERRKFVMSCLYWFIDSLYIIFIDFFLLSPIFFFVYSSRVVSYLISYFDLKQLTSLFGRRKKLPDLFSFSSCCFCCLRLCESNFIQFFFLRHLLFSCFVSILETFEGSLSFVFVFSFFFSSIFQNRIFEFVDLKFVAICL